VAMRTILSTGLLAVVWLGSVVELAFGLDDLLFLRPTGLSAWFIFGGASMAGTLTVTAVEDWTAFRSRNSSSKSVALLPPRCPVWAANR
jgi:hypothetical protein